MTTRLFDAAIAKATTLPPERQDAIAALVLEEIESEERWDTQFARSQDALAALADAAIAEDERGETRSLGESIG